MKKWYFIVLVFLSGFSFCTYYSEQELYPDASCDTTDLSYIFDIKPIFEKNCFSCHGSTGTYSDILNLENFDHIQRVVDNGRLLRNIKHDPDGTPMPASGGKLSDCNINKIEAWINRGIPQN